MLNFPLFFWQTSFLNEPNIRRSFSKKARSITLLTNLEDWSKARDAVFFDLTTFLWALLIFILRINFCIILITISYRRCNAIQKSFVSGESNNEENNVQRNNSQGASLVVLQFTRGKDTKSNECLLILCSVDGYVSCVFVSLLKILWMVTRNIQRYLQTKNVKRFTSGF